MKFKAFINLLIPLSILFVMGVAFGAYYPLPAIFNLYLIGSLVSVELLGLAYLGYLSPDQITAKRLIVGFLVVLSFCIGWSRYSFSNRETDGNHIKQYVNKGFSGPTRVIEGMVVDQPQVYPDKIRLHLKPTRILPDENTEESIPIDEGLVLVQIKPYYEMEQDYDRFASNEIYGDRLRVKASLTRPFEQANPYGFGWKQFLNARGIYGAVFYTQSLEIIEEKTGNPIWSFALQLQTEMLRTIKKTMPYPHSAFLGGATLGLRNGLAYTKTPFGDGDDLIQNQFSAAGTSHVLAVSGLHVGVIATAFWILFTGLRLPKTLSAPLVIVCLIIFTVLTGARPATIRASIMAGFTFIGMAYLDKNLSNSLLLGIGIAGICILSYNPKLVFEASFTLSFMAVLGLILFADKIDRLLQYFRGISFVLFLVFTVLTTVLCEFYWNWFFQAKVYMPYFAIWLLFILFARRLDRRRLFFGGYGFGDIPAAVRGLIAAQFAIQLGMMWPLSSYYFMRYPFSGNFTNLLAIPLVGVVVPLGLLAGVLGLIPVIGDWAALIVNAGNYLPVSGFLWICHIASEYMSYPLVQKMSITQLFILYGLLGIFAAWDQLYGWFRELWFWIVANILERPLFRPRKLFVGIISVISVIALLSFSGGKHKPDQPTVTVLSVGYGTSIAIQTPRGSNLLVGGGARIWDRHNEGKPNRMDQGKMTVAPFFLNQRIKTLEMVGTQSVEPQRIGGLPFITRQFVVEETFGPLKKNEFLPLSLKNYVGSLHDDYLAENKDASWFKNDYYGNWKRWWNPIEQKNILYNYYPREATLFREKFRGSGGTMKKIELKSLHPAPSSNYDYKSAQNRSLVLSLRIGEKSILFPGDILYDAQNELVEHYGQRLHHDVMLVPSNGAAKSSANESFFDAVDPNYVVFSTGTQEMKIKGPKAESLEKNLSKNWQKYNSWLPPKQVYRTDQDKAIVIKLREQSLNVKPFDEI